ncbi:MAG: pitrilysin family protein [Planctomycetota bacterium]
MTLDAAGDFHHGAIDPGTHVFVHPTRKFKTTTVKLIQVADLDAHTAARALVPAILRRGSVAHPSMAAVSRALEELFGASFGYEVQKFGERHVAAFRMDLVNERFLPHAGALLPRGLELMAEVLHRPLLEDGGFRADFVEQEKVNQVRAIEAVFDDKIAFARQRLVEEMFRGEPFARHELGSVAEVKVLDRKALLNTYRHERRTCPIDIYFVGDLEPGHAVELAQQLLPAGRAAQLLVPAAASSRQVANERLITEQQEIAQSKLVLGCRVDMDDLSERAYFALGVYNAILGVGSHSKLFKQVREKHSLAYYASSSLDRLVGAVFISCGINASNFERALDITRAQLGAVSEGQFDDEEMAAARKLIVNRLRSIGDEAGPIIDFFNGYRLNGRHYALRQVIDGIEGVTRADVVAAGERVSVDTVYFLKGLLEHAA